MIPQPGAVQATGSAGIGRATRRILIVGDDPAIGSLIGRALAAAGYVTDVASTGAEDLPPVPEPHFGLIIVDLLTADRDGPPARGQLRIRDSAQPHGEVVRVGRLSLDLGRLAADTGRGPVPLTRLEFLLLRELAEHAGRPVPKSKLLAAVWGYEFDPGSNVVDVCVRRLRSKLGFDLIKTVRGAGYQLAGQLPRPRRGSCAAAAPHPAGGRGPAAEPDPRRLAGYGHDRPDGCRAARAGPGSPSAPAAASRDMTGDDLALTGRLDAGVRERTRPGPAGARLSRTAGQVHAVDLGRARRGEREAGRLQDTLVDAAGQQRRRYPLPRRRRGEPAQHDNPDDQPVALHRPGPGTRPPHRLAQVAPQGDEFLGDRRGQVRRRLLPRSGNRRIPPWPHRGSSPAAAIAAANRPVISELNDPSASTPPAAR